MVNKNLFALGIDDKIGGSRNEATAALEPERNLGSDVPDRPRLTNKLKQSSRGRLNGGTADGEN